MEFTQFTYKDLNQDKIIWKKKFPIMTLLSKVDKQFASETGIDPESSHIVVSLKHIVKKDEFNE